MTEPEATSETPAPKSSGLVDLSDLRMMPAWVGGMSAPSNLSKYEEREDRGPRRDGDRRSGPPPRRDGAGFGGGAGGPGRDRGDFRPRRDGPPGAGGGAGGGPRRDRDDRGGPRRFGDRDRGPERPQREWVEIPKDIKVVIEPEDKSAEALANHIRSSGHAFSMFDAARLVLAEGERFHARFSCAPERPTGLFVASADGGLFTSREEALSHVLHSPAIETYYKAEEIELEEPKGDFKTIGVCGMTGELLGPPSHHSYQAALLRLHRERFANMPLEDYKRRIRTDTTPEVVAQWKEKQRKGQRWVYIKNQAEDAEPVTFASRAEMEAHFRRTHGEDAVIEGREVVIAGNPEKAKITHILGIMLRNAVEGARKHLFEMSQKLGGGFERRGLKLFKRRAGKLFVCRVKPRAVDPGVVFSERVSKIVEVLKSTPGMPLNKLVETIVPSATPAVEGEAKPQLTDDQISVIKDLRWLTNEGYVIEYSDGMVFLGVQGEPQATAKESTKDKGVKAETGEAGKPAADETSENATDESAAASEETTPASKEEPAMTEEPTPADEDKAAAAEEEEEAPTLEEEAATIAEDDDESLDVPSSDDLETEDSPGLDVVKGEDGPEITGTGGLNDTLPPAIEPDEIDAEPDPVAPELPTTILEDQKEKLD